MSIHGSYKKSSMKVKALVAVRSGSQRVQNKNIRPFAGSTLLEIKLAQLKRIKNLEGIIVNSNDDRMLKIASEMGCEAIKREEYYASNEVTMSEVYKNMAENFNGDIIVYANVTNPLLKDETIEKAIDTYLIKSEDYDSLNSAHLIKEFMFKDNCPINYDLQKQPRSQDLPDIYALNFAINIIERERMIECMNVVGQKPYIWGIDEMEATDIDNPIDFEFAEYVYKKGLNNA
ncbi:MAG: cytidylyltransferase [Clostridia bacterium]|nr:cytidylyltransferase [Clostridia bacterium]